MLMTAGNAARMFNEVSKREGVDSYVLVFYCEIDEGTADAAEKLDGGDGNAVESAIAMYLSMCEQTKDDCGDDND